MTALEMLIEPKITNNVEEKNILTSKNFDENIKDEFNRILENANENYNSYEKRLEKLQENDYASRENTLYNPNNDYIENSINTTQNQSQQTQEHSEKRNNYDYSNNNQHERNADNQTTVRENHNTNEQIANNTQKATDSNYSDRQISEPASKEIKLEKNTKKDEKEVRVNNPEADNKDLRNKIQLASSNIAPVEIKTPVSNTQREVTGGNRQAVNSANNPLIHTNSVKANQHSQQRNHNQINERNINIRQATNPIIANQIHSQDKTANLQSPNQVKNIQNENLRNNVQSTQNVKNTQNIHNTQITQNVQNVKSVQNTQTRVQAESVISQKNSTNNKAADLSHQQNTIKVEVRDDQVSNVKAENTTSINKQGTSKIEGITIRQETTKTDHQATTEIKNKDQANVIKQEMLKDAQKIEVKVQPVQEQTAAKPVNSMENNIALDNKTLPEKTAMRFDAVKNADSKPAELRQNEQKPVMATAKEISIEFQSNTAKDQKGQEGIGENSGRVSHNFQQNNNLAEAGIIKTSQFSEILNSKEVKQDLSSSVLDQVAKKASSEFAANKSQVTITLRPDNLGKVDINLVSQNGNLTAQITAENSQVKDILNKGLENLKQNLIDQGVNVGKLVVNVQESNTSNNHQFNQDQSFQRFDQATHNSSSHNSQTNRQTSYQETTGNYVNSESIELEEEISQTPNNIPDKVIKGRVDYRV